MRGGAKLHESPRKYRRLPASARPVLRQSFGRKKPSAIAFGNFFYPEARLKKTACIFRPVFALRGTSTERCTIQAPHVQEQTACIVCLGSALCEAARKVQQSTNETLEQTACIFYPISALWGVALATP